jgi:hypothetical protein
MSSAKDGTSVPGKEASADEPAPARSLEVEVEVRLEPGVAAVEVNAVARRNAIRNPQRFIPVQAGARQRPRHRIARGSQDVLSVSGFNTDRLDRSNDGTADRKYLRRALEGLSCQINADHTAGDIDRLLDVLESPA